MTPQRLDRGLTAYRIGDPNGAYPIFDSTGARLFPGRWNSAASPVIYTSEHYSTAMLEKLAHGNGRVPPHQHWIAITIPAGVSYEVFSTAHHPGWDAADCMVAKTYGEAWQRSLRSLILIVPSILARIENNILINDRHPEGPRVTHGLHQPIWWDGRLFQAAPAPSQRARRR